MYTSNFNPLDYIVTNNYDKHIVIASDEYNVYTHNLETDEYEILCGDLLEKGMIDHIIIENKGNIIDYIDYGAYEAIEKYNAKKEDIDMWGMKMLIKVNNIMAEYDI